MFPVFAEAAVATSAPPEALTNVIWTRKPSGEDFARVYPHGAAAHGLSANTRVKCVIASDGALTLCEVVFEDPPGEGFDKAALKLTTRFRAAPLTKDGVATEGGVVIFPLGFRTFR